MKPIDRVREMQRKRNVSTVIHVCESLMGWISTVPSVAHTSCFVVALHPIPAVDSIDLLESPSRFAADTVLGILEFHESHESFAEFRDTDCRTSVLSLRYVRARIETCEFTKNFFNIEFSRKRHREIPILTLYYASLDHGLNLFLEILNVNHLMAQIQRRFKQSTKVLWHLQEECIENQRVKEKIG